MFQAIWQFLLSLVGRRKAVVPNNFAISANEVPPPKASDDIVGYNIAMGITHWQILCLTTAQTGRRWDLVGQMKTTTACRLWTLTGAGSPETLWEKLPVLRRGRIDLAKYRRPLAAWISGRTA